MRQVRGGRTGSFSGGSWQKLPHLAWRPGSCRRAAAGLFLPAATSIPQEASPFNTPPGALSWEQVKDYVSPHHRGKDASTIMYSRQCPRPR